MATLPPFPSLLQVGVVAKRLDTSQAAAVATFCRQCTAFFTLVAGESPTDDTARHLLVSRPLSVPLTCKHVIGFERGSTLIAIVDLLEGYPDEGDWYVGLLLLSPEERARGLGTTVWTAVETWIRAEGGRCAKLMVQAQNPDAVLFWRAAGFTTNCTVAQHLPAQTNTCWCLEKLLIEPSPCHAVTQ